ncbi:MAG: hypothetical protein ACT4P7_15240 [Gemmatimonadaceae bacterium]
MLTRVSPDSVAIVQGGNVALDVAGAGFHADSNVVTIGPLVLQPVKSSRNGTTIRIMLPDRVARGGGAAPELWLTGSYQVRVDTPAGRSGSLPLFVRAES